MTKEQILDYMESKNATVLDASIHFECEPQEIHDILNKK